MGSNVRYIVVITTKLIRNNEMNHNQKQKILKLDWQGSVKGIFYQLTDNRFIYTVPDNFFGVYVIWEFVAPGHKEIIKVGQGKVRERLSAHKKDIDIVGDGSRLRIMLAAWAEVDPKYVDGVEAFLGRVLAPSVGERFPDAEEVMVNPPF